MQHHFVQKLEYLGWGLGKHLPDSTGRQPAIGQTTPHEVRDVPDVISSATLHPIGAPAGCFYQEGNPWFAKKTREKEPVQLVEQTLPAGDLQRKPREALERSAPLPSERLAGGRASLLSAGCPVLCEPTLLSEQPTALLVQGARH